MAARMIVFDAVTRGRDFYGSRPALGSDEGFHTYCHVAERVESLASLLVDAGTVPGARVALLAPNTPRFVEVILAASRIGAAVVPINHRLVGPEVAYQVADADAALAVVDPTFTDLADRGDLLTRPHLLLDDALDERASATPPYAGPRPDPSSVLIQLYTSGTTGRPKGCLLTQENWLAAATSFAHAYDIHASDVVLTALPLFHVAAMSWTLSALINGAGVLLPSRFAVERFWAAVEEHRVTIAAVPFGVRHALKHPDAARAGRSLRMMVSAPSRLGDSVLPHVEMVTGYGATELCGQVTALRGDDHRQRPGSIGALMAGCTAMIADEHGTPVATGETGELLVRGANLTAGYWRMPEATAELLRDGWLHTGDLVRADADGFLYFVDRAKDMIKTGGENVYCAEVEAALVSHPDVREVAVFGVPDERWEQAVKAVIVASSTVTPTDLDAWCLERMAPYKRPRWYEIADELPRNATGKVLKAQLRDAHDPATSLRLSER